jgi:hypothetical protein
MGHVCSRPLRGSVPSSHKCIFFLISAAALNARSPAVVLGRGGRSAPAVARHWRRRRYGLWQELRVPRDRQVRYLSLVPLSAVCSVWCVVAVGVTEPPRHRCRVVCVVCVVCHCDSRLRVQWVAHLSLDYFYRSLLPTEDPKTYNFDHPGMSHTTTRHARTTRTRHDTR